MFTAIIYITNLKLICSDTFPTYSEFKAKQVYFRVNTEISNASCQKQFSVPRT